MPHWRPTAISALLPNVGNLTLPKLDLNVTLRNSLRAKGFGLAVDDFGAGTSNIDRLRNFPFTEVKIDPAFTRLAMDEAFAKAALVSCVRLAREHGLKVVAEGVETAEVLRAVRAAGCDEAQGTFIAKPVTGDEVLNAVRGQLASDWHRAGEPWPSDRA